MSLETELDVMLKRVKGEAHSIQTTIEHNRTQRDQSQAMMDEAQGRLDDKLKLIEHLEASAPADPPPSRPRKVHLDSRDVAVYIPADQAWHVMTSVQYNRTWPS
jgi:hypothetical protein